jgi:hypothetical protein
MMDDEHVGRPLHRRDLLEVKIVKEKKPRIELSKDEELEFKKSLRS